MLKRMSLRKIAVTTCALIIMTLFYFFPSKENTIELESTITYESNVDTKSVYLIDKYNYVSKVTLPIYSKNINEIIKEKLEYLIIGGSNNDDIPNGFRPMIPSDTKILNLDLNNDVLTINFSKELLNVRERDEEDMIEAIIYTLTEIEGVNKIIIKVEDKTLEELPHSKKILPQILNRDYGINKIYDFDTLSDLTKTTIYYINEINDNIYYTPVTKVSNDTREKVTVIIDELKSSLIYQSNLSSYLSAAAELKNYEIVENAMHLTFNDKIFSNFDSKNILEEVKYTISMSIKENYDVESVIFYVNEEEITEYTLKSLE